MKDEIAFDPAELNDDRYPMRSVDGAAVFSAMLMPRPDGSAVLAVQLEETASNDGEIWGQYIIAGEIVRLICADANAGTFGGGVQ